MYAYMLYQHITVKCKSFQEFERQQGKVHGSILREKRKRKNGPIIFSQNKI